MLIFSSYAYPSFNMNISLREFVKTHVILTPGSCRSRTVAYGAHPEEPGIPGMASKS